MCSCLVCIILKFQILFWEQEMWGVRGRYSERQGIQWGGESSGALKDQVSHPHKAIRKTTVLFVCRYVHGYSLERKRESEAGRIIAVRRTKQPWIYTCQRVNCRTAMLNVYHWLNLPFDRPCTLIPNATVSLCYPGMNMWIFVIKYGSMILVLKTAYTWM
jgi:hypothetical protein